MLAAELVTTFEYFCLMFFSCVCEPTHRHNAFLMPSHFRGRSVSIARRNKKRKHLCTSRCTKIGSEKSDAFLHASIIVENYKIITQKVMTPERRKDAFNGRLSHGQLIRPFTADWRKGQAR